MAVTDQMGVLELIEHWRRIGRDLAAKAAPGASASVELGYKIRADELERAYHNDHHDAEWQRGCKHCDTEHAEMES